MSNLYSNVIQFQECFAKKVIMNDEFDKEIEFVCGIDVSYKKEIAQCSAVIVNKNTLEIVELVKNKSKVKYPYIPGLFVLRESAPILDTLKLIKNSFQILFIDGNGILHPRKCGLACYIGIITNNPTIGVAKKLLFGTLQSDGFIMNKGCILGYALKRKNTPKKTVYVSVGHKTSLFTAVELVRSLTKKDEILPEPLRIADIESKNYCN